MEDIDKTFLRLKRIDYTDLVSKIKNGPVVNPHTFEMEYSKRYESICIENGWTLKELNDELNIRPYDYK